MAQGIHPRRLSLVGDPIAIAERVNAFSASDTGVLVYSTDNRGVPVGIPGILEGQLTWFDRQGRILSTVGDPGILRIPRLSPDEQRVALEQADPETQNLDIYLFEFARGVNNRFTFSPGPRVLARVVCRRPQRHLHARAGRWGPASRIKNPPTWRAGVAVPATNLGCAVHSDTERPVRRVHRVSAAVHLEGCRGGEGRRGARESTSGGRQASSLQ